MKQTRQWVFAAILTLCGSVTGHAQDEVQTVNAYFTTAEMPDMMKFLPAPPDSTSVAFMNDVARYYWGKSMRHDEERAAQATRDAVYGLATILTEYEDAFGMKISPEETPEIYKVLLEGTATCDSICTLPKAKYMRRRPFMVFHEPTLTPDDEEALSHNGSYPSGHTLLGWSAALLMTEINPDRANEILARGYRYGENRLVVGAHWQSDTDAGRLAASAAYARLHTSERFLEQMRKARAEFQQKQGQAVGVKSAAAGRQPVGHTYRLDGMPARQHAQGVVVEDGKKLLRR
ncbi:MAG: phosphatase PAP2 family protein [Prevotella sp.]|nr:phosphatase PAP2 family protein [Prevotella sp.]